MIKNKKLRSVLFIILTVFIARFAYKYSPKRIEFLGHYEKVGAHRVNSIEKLTAALDYFEIIELDLVYFSESQTFRKILRCYSKGMQAIFVARY